MPVRTMHRKAGSPKWSEGNTCFFPLIAAERMISKQNAVCTGREQHEKSASAGQNVKRQIISDIIYKNPEILLCSERDRGSFLFLFRIGHYCRFLGVRRVGRS